MFWHLYYDSICEVGLLNWWLCSKFPPGCWLTARQEAACRATPSTPCAPTATQSPVQFLKFVKTTPNNLTVNATKTVETVQEASTLAPNSAKLLLKKFIQPKSIMVLLYTAIMKSGRHHHLTRCCRQELRMAGIGPNIPVGPIILQDPEVSRSCQLLTMFWDNFAQQEAAVLRTNTLSSSLFPSAASLISEAQNPHWLSHWERLIYWRNCSPTKWKISHCLCTLMRIQSPE